MALQAAGGATDSPAGDEVSILRTPIFAPFHAQASVNSDPGMRVAPYTIGGAVSQTTPTPMPIWMLMTLTPMTLMTTS